MNGVNYPKILLFVCILSGSFVLANGQVANSTPTPAQATQTTVGGSGGARTSNMSYPQMNSSDNNRGLATKTKNQVYRKPTKEDLLLVAPADEDVAKYADFLRQSKNGLIRLLSDEGCQENANLVSASDFCIKHKNIFGGSVYSFRKENYTIGRFGDIVYKNGKIYSIGNETLGIFTDLGENLSLAGISANTRGAKYIFDFVPPETLPKIEIYVAQLQKGIESDGFKYQRFYGLKSNHTYLLRSVAYRNKPQVSQGREVYNDLTNDERKDVIIAFQVVRFGDADKNDVTLLWKEFGRKDSPKIKKD